MAVERPIQNGRQCAVCQKIVFSNAKESLSDDAGVPVKKTLVLLYSLYSVRRETSDFPHFLQAAATVVLPHVTNTAGLRLNFWNIKFLTAKVSVSMVFSGPPTPGRKQNRRQAEGEDHKTIETHNCEKLARTTSLKGAMF